MRAAYRAVLVCSRGVQIGAHQGDVEGAGVTVKGAHLPLGDGQHPVSGCDHGGDAQAVGDLDGVGCGASGAGAEPGDLGEVESGRVGGVEIVFAAEA